MRITDRDKSILLDLHQYGLHTTRLLASRHFDGVAITTVLRRLRILEVRGLIQRITALEEGRVAWALTPLGAEEFQPAGSKVHFPRFILDHDLKLAALRMRLEEHGIARSWRPEHEIRAEIAKAYGARGMSDKIVPDGLMGVEVNGIKESVSIELELTPKNQDRYRRIFGDYYSKKNLWGVWYVVAKETIGTQLMTAAKNSSYNGLQAQFYWSLLDEVMNDPHNATLQGLKHSRKLGELWSAQAKSKGVSPAHSHAQGVSRMEVGIQEEKTQLSSEEETEILTRA